MIRAPRSYCLLLVAVMVAGCATTPSTVPPTVKLDVPPAFQTSLSIAHFQAGQDVLHIDWIRTQAKVPLTRYEGYWGRRTGRQADDHHWTIDVYNLGSPEVVAAYALAKDGYEADLDELVDFLLPPAPSPPVGPGRHALANLFARFERKHFRWGNAVSFFSQETQDTGHYAPNNCHLRYEVWEVTKDRRHTIVARASQ
jgi:hypothetical protein